jgi:hypothetical protein
MSTKKVPLMPKGTALWLKANTKLTDEQIADFCCLSLEDMDLLDEQSGYQNNPVKQGYLTINMIAKCEADPSTRLKMTGDIPIQPKKGTYLSRFQKSNLIGCVLWMKKNTPCSNKTIGKLFKRSEKYINTLEEKIQVDSNIEPKDPVELFICTFEELRNAVNNTKV